MTRFQDKIRAAQANPALQAALDANAERRINVRRQAFASLADPQAMRRQAHAIRAGVIENLDEYLDRFVQKVEQNGITVHRAADAAQAVALVLQIAQQSGAELVAKSKTMVSEEIHLNQALEQAGLRVVETDLGEYIVQIRNEPPAHIITPAVHLNRVEVGQTFHEVLGIPLTDDIPQLTAAARLVLRQVFLQAGLGLSGVNFGVVETGTLCLVTNEGNGRMVTTLPPVHVALMGIERLVPTLDDLALMLALLPRSATGQKLTVYTNLIHSPRRPGEIDGPEQRHLILVDNGRSRVKESALREILYCIRCGACLNACPIFRELGGHAYVGASGKGSAYPGPIGSVVSPALFGAAEFGALARASSLCGACKEACPVDIDLPRLLLRVRAGLTDVPARELTTGTPVVKSNAPGYLKWGLRLFTWVATSAGRYGLALRSAGLGARLLSPRRTWLRLPAFTGWGYSKDFPRPSSQPFRQRWATRQPASAASYIDPLNERWEAGKESPSLEPSSLLNQPELLDQPDLLDESSLLGQFTQELVALGGQVTHCTEEELPGLLLHTLHQRGINALMTWSEEHLPPGLFERLQAAGIILTTQPDPGIPVGLTGALAGVADTGSLVLASGPGRPLSTSLLPEIHLAVLRSDKIHRTLAPALAQLSGSAAAAIISGPSRTADIEMTLTIGVHGPKEVHVFCLR